VAFESFYSMDGDVAPIAECGDVAERHGAMNLNLDEVQTPSAPRPPRGAASPNARA